MKAYLNVFTNPFTYLLNVLPVVGLGFPLFCIQLDMYKEKNTMKMVAIYTCSTYVYL